MDKKEKLKYDSRQEDKRREASIYESTYVIGKIEGHKEGLEEGKLKEKTEIALKSLKQGLDKATIKLITGLTDIELDKLI